MIIDMEEPGLITLGCPVSHFSKRRGGGWSPAGPDTVYYRGSRRRRNSAGLCPIKMSVRSVELLNNAAHSPSAAKPTSCHLKSVVGSQYVEEEMALDIKSKTIKSFTPHVSRLVPKQLGRVKSA